MTLNACYRDASIAVQKCTKLKTNQGHTASRLCNTTQSCMHRRHKHQHSLGSLSSDAPGELKVLGHDGDALGMDAAEVCVFKEANQIGLSCFLCKKMVTHPAASRKWQVASDVCESYNQDAGGREGGAH